MSASSPRSRRSRAPVEYRGSVLRPRPPRDTRRRVRPASPQRPSTVSHGAVNWRRRPASGPATELLHAGLRRHMVRANRLDRVSGASRCRASGDSSAQRRAGRRALGRVLRAVGLVLGHLLAHGRITGARRCRRERERSPTHGARARPGPGASGKWPWCPHERRFSQPRRSATWAQVKGSHCDGCWPPGAGAILLSDHGDELSAATRSRRDRDAFLVDRCDRARPGSRSRWRRGVRAPPTTRLRSAPADLL